MGTRRPRRRLRRWLVLAGAGGALWWWRERNLVANERAFGHPTRSSP